MDPEAFLDLANQVAKLKMYPYFELAHAAVVCLTIKEDMGSGNQYLYLPSTTSLILHPLNRIVLSFHEKVRFNLLLAWKT